MFDFDRCELNPNDFSASDFPDSGKYPILASFWARGEDRDARAKMLRIVKALKARGHQARCKSWRSDHVNRYCVIGTNATALVMRDVLSDFFPRVVEDLRPIRERLRGATEGLRSRD
jgi:hypothetical protein